MKAVPKERKEAVLAKMAGPDRKSIAGLSAEEGISTATLYNWRKEARRQGRLLPDHDDSPEGWSSRGKFNAVLETAALSETKLGEYCRRHGLYPEQLACWREACSRANAVAPGHPSPRRPRPRTAPPRLRGQRCLVPGHHVASLDSFSRKIVNAEVGEHENAGNSQILLRRSCLAENIAAKDAPVTLHGDNGSPLKAGSVLALMYQPGVTPSHSRPRVSNDNPHAEAFFRNGEYHPSVPPGGFADLAEARQWAYDPTIWYNHQHRRSSLRFVTFDHTHIDH